MSMETWLLCVKAPVTIGTQTEQYGKFVKSGGGPVNFDIGFPSFYKSHRLKINPQLKDKKDTSVNIS